MILQLFAWGLGFLWIILTIAITVWWRSKWVYLYFGGANSVFNSWLSTLVGSGILSIIVIGILSIPAEWLIRHNLTFLPDVLAAYFAYRYFSKKGDNPEETAETEPEKAPSESPAALAASTGTETVRENEELEDDDDIWDDDDEYPEPLTEKKNTAEAHAFCTGCGSPLGEGDIFCAHCGKKREAIKLEK